ncbi:tetratricopeptide repeat protein [Tunturiibacter lichenicola]|uniref:tetratricopeptide repeat protein n=1 Tax=Tunturiibacter lichenicola TaxID=2051959 RepID=UPI0021B2FBEB|nr:tetratricopeptide repeat protein [Edaphobacter lichenicola]
MKRRLILRDSLTFLSLLLVTVVLFLITLFLFRSFVSHRQELAQRWSARGQASINAGHPDQAIVALRTALSYAPGRRDYELLLAQALGDAGHTEESYNYYLGLWETEPGSGIINLSLARLAAKKNDPQTAINYYRASIYGTWEGDGTMRRREVRLELSRYLLAQHNFGSARTELLIAGGNAPDDTTVALTLAPLLEQANAPRDALTYYQKVLAQDPKNQTALEAAARLEYDFGHFEDAHRMMEQAIREHKSDDSNQEPITTSDKEILDNASRILAIAPLKKLPNDERVARILKARDLAKKRLDACNTTLSIASGLPSPLQDLRAKWTSKEATLNRADLLNDPAGQDTTMLLVFDTETQTAKICGAPTGDDALLLLLARTPKALEP